MGWCSGVMACLSAVRRGFGQQVALGASALGGVEEGLPFAAGEEECPELAVFGVANPGDRPLCNLDTGAPVVRVARLVPGSGGDKGFFGDRARSHEGLLYSSISVLTRLRSEEHTSELQSRFDLVCRLLLET